MRVKPCSKAIARARLKQAREFFASAELLRKAAGDKSGGNAYVTLYVHAGIAAADALCCFALGQHAQGDSHADAAQLLRGVSHAGELADSLATLLGMKSLAGYSDQPVNAQKRKQAERAASKLVTAANERVDG